MLIGRNTRESGEFPQPLQFTMHLHYLCNTTIWLQI